MSSNGSESEEQRRNAKEEKNAGGERKKVVERVMAKIGLWENVELKREGRGDEGKKRPFLQRR